MCDCENNVVDLQQLKIYTIMAKYKALTSSQKFNYGGNKSITITKSSSQEELAVERSAFIPLSKKPFS